VLNRDTQDGQDIKGTTGFYRMNRIGRIESCSIQYKPVVTQVRSKPGLRTYPVPPVYPVNNIYPEYPEHPC
jgi:hypothetical protein